jgi:hypothetical protein
MSKQKTKIRKGKGKGKTKAIERMPGASPVEVAKLVVNEGVRVVRGRGRPRVMDPRISTHLQLTKAQRDLCFAAAEHLGLSFAAWSRSVLLAQARVALRSPSPNPEPEESSCPSPSR